MKAPGKTVKEILANQPAVSAWNKVMMNDRFDVK